MTARADMVKPPLEGETFYWATSTSSKRVPIPPEWQGRYVTFYAVSQELNLVFGDSAVDSDYTAATEAGTTLPLTGNDAQGVHISPDTKEGVPFLIPASLAMTHFAVEAAAAGGLRATVSS